MIKAFLSHSSSDKEIVREIKEKLTRAWTYFDEDCFEPGEDFRDAIVDHIEESKLFVLFASEASLKSSWVNFELDTVYWETIKKKSIQVLVLNLDNVKIEYFPKWMRKAKIQPIDNIKIATQIILDKLSDFIKEETLYVGRAKETEQFNKDLFAKYSNFPNVIALSGLEGIGRRTFAKRVIYERFNLKYELEIHIKDYEGIDELHRYLISDNITSMSQIEKEEEINTFITASDEEKYCEIARILAEYSSKNAIPVLVDDGGLLDNDGYYRKDVLNVLKIFAEKFKGHYLLLVHRRYPKLKTVDSDLVYTLKIGELSFDEIFQALDTLLKRNSITSTNKADIEELAKYLDGYPPALYYAVKECSIYGIDVVCGDKRKLTDFKSGLFTGYLNSINIEELGETILKLIYNFEVLDVNTMSILLKITREEICSELIKLIDFNLVYTTNENYYRISSPIKVAIGRRVSLFSKKEMTSFSHELIEEFNKNEFKSLTYIDNIITSLLYANNDKELNRFKSFLLPSKLLEVAQKYNIDRDWKTAERYTRKALEVDPDNFDAKILLFKLLVRLETKSVSHEKEENDLLSELDERYDPRRFYLRGFRFRKRNKFMDAIEQFELGKKAGDDSIQIHRDLAECYFQINDLEKSKQEIEIVMKPGRKIENAFILDLAAKIAIYSNDFDSANDLISRLELVDRPENVNHRKAVLAIKEKKYDDAMRYSTKACSSKKVLPQMILLHMNIALHRKNYDVVESDYNRYKKTYKHQSDMLEVLYSTMLLYRDGWQNADAGFSKVLNKENPIALDLRYKIIQKQLKDPNTSLANKKRIEKEIEALKNSRKSDVLTINQYYESRDINNIGIL